MDKQESIRIHTDWWCKCRSCLFWQGTDAGDGSGSAGNHPRWNPGACSNPASDMYQQETWTEGHCAKWDSFDIETALEMLEESQNNPRRMK